MTINLSMASPKTTIAGIVVILLTAAGPVLDHYHPLFGLSWTAITLSLAVAVGGGGLVAAKDGSTGSTLAQVTAKQAQVEATTVPAALQAAEQVKAADQQVAGK